MRSIIAVDFDGTVVTHEYPEIGEPVPYALECMRFLRASGVDLILWTMRSGEELQAAVDYLKKNDIEMFGINENPEQRSWTQSPKAYAQKYIDDAAMGCPLIHPDNGGRPYVDWIALFPTVTAQPDQEPQ